MLVAFGCFGLKCHLLSTDCKRLYFTNCLFKLAVQRRISTIPLMFIRAGSFWCIFVFFTMYYDSETSNASTFCLWCLLRKNFPEVCRARDDILPSGNHTRHGLGAALRKDWPAKVLVLSAMAVARILFVMNLANSCYGQGSLGRSELA